MVPDPWYCDDPRLHRYWLDAVTEIIDRYQPDVLYSDGALPFGEVDYAPGLDAVAHLYNTSAQIHGTNRAWFPAAASPAGYLGELGGEVTLSAVL